MNQIPPNMVDMMALCTSGTPVVRTAPVAHVGTPVVPDADGWKLFVFRGPNISWTVTGRKIGTSIGLRAEKLSYEMVELFDPNAFWKR